MSTTAPGTTALNGTEIEVNFPPLINGLKAAPAGMSTVEIITLTPSVIAGSPVNALRTWAQLVKSATRHVTATSFRTKVRPAFHTSASARNGRLATSGRPRRICGSEWSRCTGGRVLGTRVFSSTQLRSVSHAGTRIHRAGA